jgi:hypothetical protein
MLCSDMYAMNAMHIMLHTFYPNLVSMLNQAIKLNTWLTHMLVLASREILSNKARGQKLVKMGKIDVAAFGDRSLTAQLVLLGVYPNQRSPDQISHDGGVQSVGDNHTTLCQVFHSCMHS